MIRCQNRRPAGHKPHPKLSPDGRFRIRWIEGREETEELTFKRFKAYVRAMERTYRRTAWAKRMRLKKRVSSRWKRATRPAGAQA